MESGFQWEMLDFNWYENWYLKNVWSHIRSQVRLSFSTLNWSTSWSKLGLSLGWYCQQFRITKYLEYDKSKWIWMTQADGVLHFNGARWRLLHAIALLYQPEERFNVVQFRVRRFGERGHLPQEHAERPDVRLTRVESHEQRLGRHPLHRQQSAGARSVIFTVVNISCQAEIGYLQSAVLAHENVPSSQITMNTLEIQWKVLNNKVSTRSSNCWFTFFELRYAMPTATWSE